MPQQSRGARVSVFVDDEWLTCDDATPEESWKEIEKELTRHLKRFFTPSHGVPPKDIFAVFEEWEGASQAQELRFDRRRQLIWPT